MPPKKAADPVQDEVTTRLYASCWRAQSEIEAQIDVVEHRRKELPAGGFDEELAKCAAQLSQAIVKCSMEIRQLEKHDRRMTLTPAQRFDALIKYVKTLSIEQIEALGGVVDAIRMGRAA